MRMPLAIRLAPLIFLVALLLIWEAVVVLFAIPRFFLPPPSAVAQAFVQFSGAIWRESVFTLTTTIVGFALAVAFGLGLGLLVGWSRTIYAGLYPLMIGFNAVPQDRVVPVLVL